MKIEKGSLLKVTTKTQDDVFGDVLWEIDEIGLPAPEKERAGENDGVRCIILGGTGPAARKGFVVIDSEARIAGDVANGITEIKPASDRDILMSAYPEKVDDPVHSGSGCFEVEM